MLGGTRGVDRGGSSISTFHNNSKIQKKILREEGHSKQRRALMVDK